MRRIELRNQWCRLIIVLLVALIAAGVLLLVLSEYRQQITEPWLTSLDQGLMSVVHSWARPWLTDAMLAFSFLGSWEFVVPLSIVLVLCQLSRGAKGAAGLLAIAVGGSAALNLCLKYWFHRARPAVPWALTSEASFSFPSGHAVTAFCLYATLAYLHLRSGDKRIDAAWMVAALFMTLGIGLSRVYLGVHYPSDIAAGYLVGGFWVTAVILLPTAFGKDCFSRCDQK
jgi:undecaprenyl-diphosphatase